MSTTTAAPPSAAAAGELELRDYLTVLKRRKGIIALTAVVVVGAALALSLSQQRVYSASTEVLLQSRTSEQILNPDQQQQQGVQQQQNRVQTEIEVMKSRSVMDAVTGQLGYSPDVSIAAKGQTDVVTISSRDTSPTKAAREANTYATTYVDVRRKALIADLLAAATQIRQQITGIDSSIAALDRTVSALDVRIAGSNDPLQRRRLSGQRDQLVKDNEAKRTSLETRRGAASEQVDKLQLSADVTQTGGAQIVSKATRPTAPVAPTPKRDAVIALFLGLLLGAGLAFLFEYLDDSMRTKDDLDRATDGLDVLGLVPKVDTWKDRRAPTLVSITSPTSAPAEAYRGLRTSLQFIGIERAIKFVQVTSPSAAEGKSTTLANLGVALARAGQRVVIVDCDLRRPRLHQFVGIDNSVGLTSVILGDVPMAEALQPIPDQPRLSILPSGRPPPNPSELLSTKRAQDLIRSLASEADYVLIDTPPLLPVADAVVVSGFVDATILVVTARSTTKRATRRAIELLRQVNAPLIGAVFNGVGGEAAYAYGYGYGYGYGYANSETKEPRRRVFRRNKHRQTGTDEQAQTAAQWPARQSVGDSNG